MARLSGVLTIWDTTRLHAPHVLRKQRAAGVVALLSPVGPAHLNIPTFNNKPLLDEADIKNYPIRSILSKPKAEAHNIDRGLDNS